MPSIIDCTHLSRTGVVIHKVSEIRSYTKNYIFSVISRSRTVRFGRNKELVLTNKQKQLCKELLFLNKGVVLFRSPSQMKITHLL